MQNFIVDRKKKSLYGFNVEGFNTEARKIIERILQKYRPSATVYSNDYIGAQKLYDITEGQSLIIHRTYQPNNVESSWENWTANNWKDFYKSKSVSPIYQTFLNNPIVANSENRINEYIGFVIEILRWAMENNYHLTFPLPDSNVTKEALMDKGSFDKLLLAYDDYGFREFGHIGAVKEQIPFHLNLATALSRKRNGLENLSAQTLLKYEFMQKSYWPTYEEVNITDWQSNEYLYRSVWINKRMEQLGRKPIPVVVTEFNWGDNATFGKWTDSNDVVRNIQKEIVDLYKIDPSPYPIFSGIMSLKTLYENIFKLENKPSETFEQTVYNQIEHIQKITPDNYIGLCWYTLDPGSALRDLRAGLSYQKLIENLEPMLYNMVDKLSAESESKEEDPAPITPVVNIINVITSSDGKDTDKPSSEQIASIPPEIKPTVLIPVTPATPVTPTTQVTTTTQTIVTTTDTSSIQSSPTASTSSNTDKPIPTLTVEGLKLNVDTKRSSQITLKVEDKTEKSGSKTVDGKTINGKTTESQMDVSSDKAVNDWKVFWVSSVGMRSNIRLQPNVKSEAIGKIEEGESLYYVGKQLLEIDNLGYRWIPISDYANEKKSVINIKGWVREDAVKLRRYEFLYDFPVSIVVTVTNASVEEVEWIKRKITNGDIKVEIKVD